MKSLLSICLLCVLLTGCAKLDSGSFWIRENISETTPIQTETAESQPEQTEETTGLRLDGSISEGPVLCFAANLQDLCNDLGILWECRITSDSWHMEETAAAPYSRGDTQYLRLDADPILKNEPTLCVYLTEEEQLCEVTAILLTHDWTQAQEESFLQLGVDLLQCFWPDCETQTIQKTVSQIREDITENVYPDHSAAPRPLEVYVNGNAAAYGYTHAANISIHVIPVDENRLQELEYAGVSIHFIG